MVKKKDLKSKSNIIKVAFALFLEKGYKEVTIKNIMEATNLSKGAIYHHFESKEEIYYATIETYYINLFQTVTLENLTDNFKDNIELITFLTLENCFIICLETDKYALPST